MRDPDAHHPVRHFGTDGWGVLECSPIAELLGTDEDWDKGLTRLGWAEFSRTGPAVQDIASGGSAFHLLVLHRPDSLAEPQFFVELSGNVGDCLEQVFVQDLPSLMGLLASWAPVLHATAVAHLAAVMPA